MAETVQDVFDDLLDSFKDLYKDDEFSYPGVADQEEAEYRERFADALAAEKGPKSTRLADKQKNCRYCHEPFDEIVKNRSWDGASIHLNAQDELVSDAISNGIRNSASVNFCPMCGRRLEEK